jgi:hypothetical protein
MSTLTNMSFSAGQHFERHRLTQLLQARLNELERITAETGPEGRAAILAAEVRRIIGQLENEP